MSDIESRFPNHKAGLHLTHDDHRSNYESVAEWERRACGEDGYAQWVSPEERLKAITYDTVWVLQWYPNTPVGFCALAASDLDVLLDAAKDD